MTKKNVLTGSCVHTHTHTHTHTRRDFYRQQVTNGNAKRVFTRYTGIVLLSMLFMFTGFNTALGQCDNYDLSFSGVEELNCYDRAIDSYSINDNNVTETFQKLSIIIIYTGNITIYEDETREYLNDNLKDKYEPYSGNTDIVNFEPNKIKIEAKLKNGENAVKIKDLLPIITIYFTANPGESVEFSYDWVPWSNSNTRYFIYPTGAPCAPLNTYPEPYTFASSEMSGVMQTNVNCDGPYSNHLQDALVSYYNIDKEPGIPYAQVMSNDLGEFSSPGQPDCTVKVSPAKDNVPADCGLDGQDINLIQQFILGNISFAHAYQPLSADANGDFEITTLDMIYINNAILGLPLGTGWVDWKFVPQAYYDSYHPSMIPIPPYDPFYIRDVENNDMPYFDFMVLKTGNTDLVFNCDQCSATPGTGSLAGEAMGEEYIDYDIEEGGDDIVVTLENDNLDTFANIGMDIRIEPVGLILDTMIMYNMSEEIPGYNFNQSNGELKMMWLNKYAYDTSRKCTGNTICEIRLKKENYLKEDVDIEIIKNSKINKCVIQNITNKYYDIKLRKKLELRDETKQERLKVFPTVIYDRFNMKFYEKRDNKVIIKLYNLYGEEVKNIGFSTYKGLNSVSIPDLQNLKKGIYLYKVKLASKTYTGKIIKQ